jgi:glycogen synthase
MYEEYVKQLRGETVVLVSPELKSFKSRAGGLGPAVEELALALSEVGMNVKVISVLYTHWLNNENKLEKIDYSNFEFENLGEVEFTVAKERIKAHVKKYKAKENLEFYFIQNEKYGKALYLNDLLKFAIFLGKGTLEILKNFKIETKLIHLNDALTSLVVFYAKHLPQYSKFKDCKYIFTIHNAGIAYQQIYPKDRIWELEVDNFDWNKVVYNDNLNLFYLALNYCDKLNTVSKDYAFALLKGNEGFDWIFREKGIIGIVNGIDINYWRAKEFKNIKNRKKMLEIKQKLKKKLIQEIKMRTGKELDENRPIIVMPRRIADQKGFNTIFPLIEEACKPYPIGLGFQFIVLGRPHPNDPIGKEWQRKFEELNSNLKEFVYIYGFDEELAKLMYWGGDIILYPSLPDKEPCGTGYMMAAVNGTVCIGTKTGGLAEIFWFDEVNLEGNSILVWEEEYSTQAFYEKLKIASELYYKHKKMWENFVYAAFNLKVNIFNTVKCYIAKVYYPLIK